MPAIIINNIHTELKNVAPTTTLLRFLRDQLQKTGTKEGCAEGDCGACSVIVIEECEIKSDESKRQFRTVNACLVPVLSLSGKSIWTVEGLAKNNALHPVQKVMVEKLGSQCGYCTPGIIMSMFEAYYRDDMKEPWQIDDQLCGNLCRCTGYRPIREAAQSIIALQPKDQFTNCLLKATELKDVQSEKEGKRFVAPTSFKGLWENISKHPDATFVCGATDLGLDITKKNKDYDCLIAIDRIPELKGIEERLHNGHPEIVIGAATTITDVENQLAHVLPSLSRMYRYFGSRQIKNRATMGGNLCTASPIGDSAPILLAYDAEITLMSQNGPRRVALREFFLGYREIDMQPNEILSHIHIRIPLSDWKIRAFKVSKRREMDISAVAAGMAVRCSEGIIEDVRLAYGGMAATPKRAQLTEAYLRGKRWNRESILEAMEFIEQDFRPLSDHRGSAWYRQRVAKNLLLGFFEEVETREEPSLPYPHVGTILVEQA